MHSLKKNLLICSVALLVSCGGGSENASSAPAPVAVSLPPIGSQVARPWNEVLATGQAHTIQGNVSIIDNFPMPQLNKTRRIWIYLPADYALSATKYPVLYMQDGQNVFDTATSYAGEWAIDEAMLQMEQEAAKFSSIVVAIDNGGADRSDEYLAAGHAKQYVDFIVSSLKPFIDGHYRTLPDRDHTAIAGSSYGAYVSLYAGLTHQDVFGKIAAFSNVSVFDGGLLQQMILQAGRQQDMRIYLDIGQPENSQFFGVVDSDEQIYKRLISLGFNTQQLSFVIDPAGIHNEASWKRRFPAAWRWLNP